MYIETVQKVKEYALDELGIAGDPGRPVYPWQWWKWVNDIQLAQAINAPIEQLGELETTHEYNASLEDTPYKYTKKIGLPSDCLYWIDVQAKLDAGTGAQYRKAQPKTHSKFERGTEAQNYFNKPTKKRPWVAKEGKYLLVSPITSETILPTALHMVKIPNQMIDDHGKLQVTAEFRPLLVLWVASKAAVPYGLFAEGKALLAEYMNRWEALTGRKWNAFRREDYELPLEPGELPRGEKPGG